MPKREITDTMIAKLPRWARDEIRRLNMRYNEAIEMRDAALGQVKNPGPLYIPGYNLEPDQPIPGKHINVRLPNDPRGFSRYIEINVVDGDEVRVYSHGGDLFIIPRASNAAVLDVQHDR